MHGFNAFSPQINAAKTIINKHIMTMLKNFKKIKIYARYNMKGIISDNLIKVMFTLFSNYYNKTISKNNLLVCLKADNKNDRTMLTTPFSIVNDKFFDIFLRQLVQVIRLYNSVDGFKNFKDLYFVILHLPIDLNLTLTSTTQGIHDYLPNSMRRGDWEKMLKTYDFLRVNHFKTTVNKGWMEYEIHLFDSRTQESHIIFDVRAIKDDHGTFLRSTNINYIHYIDSRIVKFYIIDNNPLIYRELKF